MHYCLNTICNLKLHVPWTKMCINLFLSYQHCKTVKSIFKISGNLYYLNKTAILLSLKNLQHLYLGQQQLLKPQQFLSLSMSSLFTSLINISTSSVSSRLFFCVQLFSSSSSIKLLEAVLCMANSPVSELLDDVSLSLNSKKNEIWWSNNGTKFNSWLSTNQQN